jgi:hypothetical protein
MGRVDAVEVKRLLPGANAFGALSEWYRYLNCGYRIGLVGGTDKTSAATPLGGVRTYA